MKLVRLVKDVVGRSEGTQGIVLQDLGAFLQVGFTDDIEPKTRLVFTDEIEVVGEY